jgi:hypothetical protein
LGGWQSIWHGVSLFFQLPELRPVQLKFYNSASVSQAVCELSCFGVIGPTLRSATAAASRAATRLVPQKAQFSR